MVDLRLLRQFVAVAEELHFHRAAARLHMSQPPLTAAIRKLEDEIGSELIQRGNRTLGLTAAGAVLLAEARLLLQQADHALVATRDAAEGRTGTVRLGYVGSALYGRLPGVIRSFRQGSPDVRLELIEATSARQIQMLREQRIDVGVVIPPVFEADDMRLQAFDSDRLAIALPRAHPLAEQAHLTVAMLADEPFVLWPAREGRGFHSQVVRLCAAAGFTTAGGAGSARHARGAVTGGGGGGHLGGARQHGRVPQCGSRLSPVGGGRGHVRAAAVPARR